MYRNPNPNLNPSPNPEPNPNLSGERPTRGSRVAPPSVPPRLLSGEVPGLATGLAAPGRGRTVARRGEKAASLVSGRVSGGRGRIAET